MQAWPDEQLQETLLPSACDGQTCALCCSYDSSFLSISQVLNSIQQQQVNTALKELLGIVTTTTAAAYPPTTQDMNQLTKQVDDFLRTGLWLHALLC